MSNVPLDHRIAPAGAVPAPGPITLINRFAVRPEEDEEFLSLWTQTSQFFMAQPGFISLRLHRALDPAVDHRWVNVADWQSEAQFRNAHAHPEFHRLVSRPGWAQFPNLPTLFTPHLSVDHDPTAARIVIPVTTDPSDSLR